MNDAPEHRRPSPLATVGFVAALCAAFAVAGAGPLYRFGALGLHAAFRLMGAGVWAGAAAALVCAVAVWLTRAGKARGGLALVGAGVATLSFLVPMAILSVAQRTPAIHDISTDTQNPPRFSAIVPLRGAAIDTPASDRAGLAAQQHAAYPDVLPVRSSMSPGQAFERALRIARDMGWVVISAEPERGRLEATDRTFWFGFVDDVVVRVTPEGEGSRIDVRSVSRIGQGDLGKNAKRIRRFVAAFAP
jgi:uncharacterized protein (DUF1499 family)